jgi:hypothetical protein
MGGRKHYRIEVFPLMHTWSYLLWQPFGNFYVGDTFVSTYTVEKLPDEPILYSLLSESWSASELPAVIDEVAAILDAADEPLFYINSIENVTMNIQELITSSSLAARGGGSILHHPNIREQVVVVQNKLLQLAAKGLDSAAFGHLSMKVFETEDEAFAYARAQIAEG